MPKTKAELIAMASRGGIANRDKHADDPMYFIRLGKLGAAARNKKRKAKQSLP